MLCIVFFCILSTASQREHRVNVWFVQRASSLQCVSSAKSKGIWPPAVLRPHEVLSCAREHIVDVLMYVFDFVFLTLSEMLGPYLGPLGCIFGIPFGYNLVLRSAKSLQELSWTTFGGAPGPSPGPFGEPSGPFPGLLNRDWPNIGPRDAPGGGHIPPQRAPI